MTERVLRAALEHWALAGATVSLLAARENQVYRVETGNGPAALRLHRPGYRSEQEIHSEILWMAMLADNGIALPRPVQATDGTCVHCIDGFVVDLLTWVEGKPLSQLQPDEKLYYRLGRLLVRMHSLADAWQPPADFVRPSWDLVGENPTWDRFWENPMLSPQQRNHFLAFRDQARVALETLGTEDYGLIHADLIPDNVLYDASATNAELQPIDFDDGGYGYRLFDLATITHRSRCRYASEQYARATIAGYTGDQELDQQALSLFEALRACSYVGWNITRIDEATGVERNARFIAEAERAIQALRSLC